MIRSGSDLHKDVVEELAFDPSVDEREIAVSVHDGVVTLTGTVHDYLQKIAAEKAVKRVRGVHGIAEELTVDLPARHKRSDVDLGGYAAEAVRWNATLAADSVNVIVEAGWITLTGTVDWRYQLEAARLAVAPLAGVCGITNDIAIRKRVVVGDIRNQIHDWLKRSADLDAGRVHVEATGGTVTLRGPVHSWTERDDATVAAYSIAGVAEVRNLMTVS